MSEIMEETQSARLGKGMRLLRYSVFTLLVLSVASIGAKMVSQSAQITSLQTALGQVPGRDAVQQELDKLNGQVISNSETLKTLSASLEEALVAPVVDKTAFDHLAQQVRTLETKVSLPVSSDAQALQGVHASMALLQARVDTLEQRAGAAQTPVTKPAISAVNPGATTPTVKNTPTRSARSVAAPFRLTSIERRGGTVFVAVAPLQAFNLADIRLVETGETVQGWTLLSAGGNQAQFSVAGRTQTLTVQ
ncbi:MULTISPECIES: hypothetical protein [Serratia]|jgi:Skp family chaperone for outer membrane proteins|uniref:hypothetical protein n=1 Tax=Serratia TaxID=613 RepID=UPI001A2203BD|nr:hypothetical protein [Serratia liquefaciens]EKN4906006.1 hypothetical protein [Yersinia enterocolitica]HAT3729550.1 hypothetical protein [Serratia marcescens]HEN3244267.1 hypothetical protein [Yersinia enterocolitica]HEN3450980.1 hypothetical protein [Yersinia enterocolitica]